jgi:hypothetical protein
LTINGAEIGTETLAMRGPLTGDPWGLQILTDEAYVPPLPGTYTFRTTALQAGTPAMPVSWTFRVIAAGGGGIDTVTGAPKVIPGLMVPRGDATGVPVKTFLEVSFTEPVRSIPGNVVLEDAEGNDVPVRISGVRSGPSPVVVDPLTSAEDVVTSLTIQPLTSLRYSTQYRLKLRSAIVDLDTPRVWFGSRRCRARRSVLPHPSSRRTRASRRSGRKRSRPRGRGRRSSRRGWR